MPMFYMMVGLPGSGKSFTAESIPNAVVHSSDAIRAEVLGDENDQTQQDLVFQTLTKGFCRIWWMARMWCTTQPISTTSAVSDSLIVSERSTNMICVQYVFSWRRPMRCVWSATIIGNVLSRSL